MPPFGEPAADDSQGVAIFRMPQGSAAKAPLGAGIAIPEVDEELEQVRELSVEKQVYIYSVGAWQQQVDGLGSMGQRVIVALPKEKVLQRNDLSVAGPLIIPGLPSETSPTGDNQTKRIYHKPKKSDPFSRHTGLHFAMEIVGCGPKSPEQNDLRSYGVFISLIPEQPRPAENADRRPYQQWKAKAKAWTLPPRELWGFLWEDSVLTAQKAFRSKLMKIIGKANQAHKRGDFDKLYRNTAGESDDQLYMIADILGLTKAECPWLENVSAEAAAVQCIACDAPLAASAIRCNKCGAKQVSDEEYDAELKRRQTARKGGGNKKAN